jgi:RNase P protein component
VSQAEELVGQWDFRGAREVLVHLVAREPTEEGFTARVMLADVLRELGENDAAYQAAVEVARESRDRYGSDHPLTVRAATVLGTVLHDRGSLTAAEQQYRLAVHSGVSGKGDGARAVLRSRANLALLYRDRGADDVAEFELRSAYRAQRRAFGPGDPDTLRLGVELGRLYAGQAAGRRARRLLGAAYRQARKSLGAEHPLTVIAADALETAVAEQLARPVARRPGLIALLAVVAVVAVAALAVTAVLVLHRRTVGSRPGAVAHTGAPSPSPAGAADAARQPPNDLTLRDGGTSITLTWQDPSRGTGTVLLAVMRIGQPAGPLRPLPAGTERYVVNGLDPHINYCVIVAVVYPGDTAARPAQICTSRH